MEILLCAPAAERCRLCLSTERAMRDVAGVLWAFQVVTGATEQPLSTSGMNTTVCWECRAMLQKLQAFKQQAINAQIILNDSQNPTFPPVCLSRLAAIHKTMYDAEYFDNFQNDLPFSYFNDSQLETIICDPKVEAETEDEDVSAGVWVDTVEYDDDKNEIPLTDSKEILEVNGSEAAVDESRLKSRKDQNRSDKMKSKKSKKTAEKIVSLDKRKSSKTKLKKPSKATGPLETCEECGGLRRKAQTVEAGDNAESAVDTPYQCVACNIAFKFEKSLYRHNKDKHSGLAAVVACSCEASRPQLRREDKSNPKIKLPQRNAETGTFDCDVCGARLKSDEYFRLHYEAHVSDKSFECATCGNLYKTRAQMFKHLIVHQPHRYLCHICGKSKLSMGSLKIHFLSHSSLEERPHKCDVCSRTFITRDKLKIHSRFHDGVKPFKCALCSSAFYVNFELTKHMKTSHAIGAEKAKREKMKRTVSLCRNARMKHGAKPEDQKTEEEKKNKSTKRKNDLTCDICGRTFAQKVCLDAHVVVHTGDRPFKCDECGQTFKFQSNVLTHAKSVHMVDKVHQCTVCGARFKLKGNLTAHVKIHSGDKPFSCDICDQKFIRNRNLRNHYKVHAK